jgi:hypothetical protein
MVRARLALLALTATAGLAGCGDDGPGERAATVGRRASPAPQSPYAVAYAVARDDLPELARAPLPDALEDAEVVATSESEPYTLVVLQEWLHERGIDIEPPAALDEAADAASRRWDASVVVIAAEHARRYGRRLAKLHPSREELGEFYDEFNAGSWPGSGRAMAHWLGIVQRSVERVGDDGGTVVIPVTD